MMQLNHRRSVRWATNRVAIVAIALIGNFVSSASACNIPVFRYALERWQPDNVEIIVFGAGGHTDASASPLQRLQQLSQGPNASLNAKIVQLDPSDSLPQPYAGVWAKVKDDVTELPYVVVQTKVGQGRVATHLQGSLGEIDLNRVIESPARNELQQRLLAGHSIVWLMIRSKDAAKNALAKDMLEKAFKTLESEVEIPEGVGLPGSELYADVPLVVRFSILEIDPDDEQEQFLLDLLTGIRSDATGQSEPLLVPVFGRGRALEVLAADQTTPTMIQELTKFLAGACSCQVKEQNPGFDLMIRCDWEGELFGGFENRPPDRSAEEGLNRQPTLVPIPPGRKK
ncbi:hypothetical protein [Rhodopirellula sp. MGV]|uniref:hypothetical protein n=1 Tax=Rhodopirellula sp. MGV TaxID=2023130 RepID=UPI000B960CD0|nr:hypothetical protein [Rhodopirellula sp. MGV]OYP36330.1 hypothetical protein CGZ80_08400 [Rhodopirellula sp. MGV]PNY38436.1 hypothetical protein C2E31_00380 [Rhodopirellula baltica]